MARFNLARLALAGVFIIIATLALSPFVVYVVNVVAFRSVASISCISNAYLDLGKFLDCVGVCLSDPTYRYGSLFLALVFVALLLANAASALLKNNSREVEDGILGNERVFNKKHDILKRNYAWDGQGKPPVDGICIGGYKGKMLLAPANHAAVIAPSGSGKTRGSVYETIDALSFAGKNSLIVLDPSGEIYAMMAQTIKERGYSVNLIDLEKSRRGARYNPLHSITERYRVGDESSAEARAREIADIICPEKGNENDFFTRAAGGILASVCYIVATDEDVPDADRHIWSVAQTIAKGTKDGSGKLKDFIKSHGEDSAPYMMAQTFITASDKVENSILSSLNDALQPFTSAEIKYLTSASEVTVDQPIEHPTVIFLRTLPKGRQQNKVVSLFLAQHLTETLRRGDRSSMTPVYIIGDEFHAVPKFDLITGVEQGRKYKLHYYMWVQSLAAFDTYSTREENGKEAVLSNTDVKVLYKAGSESDARYFEVIGGKRTVQTKNVGTSTTSKKTTDSEGYSERDVLNWSQGELLARDPVEDGICVFTNIYGESKHNGRFEIPVPDVTLTPTAQHFPTFGSREHEQAVIQCVTEQLEQKANPTDGKLRINIFKAWTPPDFEQEYDKGEQEDDEDVFGI